MVTPAMLRAALTGEVDISAAMPGGIEASEKLGQITFVHAATMPRRVRPDRAAFESFGFTFGDPIDELFLAATLPNGWKKQATDHDMWSYILDERGRKRVAIFYKAAFYDRSAHASLEQRYSVDSYREVSPDRCMVCVMDAGTELQCFGEYTKHDYKAAEPLEAAAAAWLKENRPNADDLLTSWNEP